MKENKEGANMKRKLIFTAVGIMLELANYWRGIQGTNQ